MLAALPITSLYLGLFILMLLVLAIGVVRVRLKTNISLGDGGNNALNKAIRAHGNATEYVPIVMLALALLELAGANITLLHVYGSVFLLSRFAHAFGMQHPNEGNNFRKIGIVSTWLVMLCMGIQLILSTF